MKTPKHYERGLGVLAAQNYLLRRHPCVGTVKAIEEMGNFRAQFPCLHGINLPSKVRQVVNVLGKELPDISC